MKILIIYKSKTGFTKKYAEWVSQELICDMVDYEKVSQSSIAGYDVIVFGSRIHAEKIEGLQEIKQLVACNKTCKFIVFVNGATPATGEDAINEVWENIFSQDELQTIPHFYMVSDLNYEKMSFEERTVAKMLSNKKFKSDAELGMEQALAKSYDASSLEYIATLVNYVKNIDIYGSIRRFNLRSYFDA